MVFAAPFFLMAQTRAMRNFMVANREGFKTMGFAVLVSWMSLHLLSKIYERDKYAEDAACSEDDKQAMLRKVQDAAFLKAALQQSAAAAAASGAGAASGASVDTAALARALSEGLQEAMRDARRDRLEGRTQVHAKSPAWSVAAGAEGIRVALTGKKNKAVAGAEAGADTAAAAPAAGEEVVEVTAAGGEPRAPAPGAAVAIATAAGAAATTAAAPAVPATGGAPPPKVLPRPTLV